jgi:hypothetical protein
MRNTEKGKVGWITSMDWLMSVLTVGCFIPTRTSRNQDVDIQNMLKTSQWVRVQGVFFKKFYPVCVAFYSLVTKTSLCRLVDMKQLEEEKKCQPGKISRLRKLNPLGEGDGKRRICQ